MRYNLVCSGENPATNAGTTRKYALVAELADAPDLGSGRGNSVEVQVLSGAPKNLVLQNGIFSSKWLRRLREILQNKHPTQKKQPRTAYAVRGCFPSVGCIHEIGVRLLFCSVNTGCLTRFTASPTAGAAIFARFIHTPQRACRR